jgi:zinc protease
MRAPAPSERPISQRFDLEDGGVAYFEPAHGLPLVSVHVCLRCGSAHDPRNKAGLARLASKMLLRGCEGIDSRAIEDTMDRLGAELAVDAAPPSVALRGQVLSRNLEAFVDLLARLLSAPTFLPDELEALKREVVSEIIATRDDDCLLAQRAFQRVLFEAHPYARDAAGTPTSVASITRDDVRTFLERSFARLNTIIGLAGDVARERAPEMAGRIVGGLPAGLASTLEIPEPRASPGRRLVFVDKPDRTQTQVVIGTLGTSPRDPDHAALLVANAVLGGASHSRMVREVRNRRGWSYGASSRLGIDRRRHALLMWTFPDKEEAAECIALEIRLLEEFVDGGVTPRETSVARRYLARSHAFDVDTAQKRLQQALDIELLDLPLDYYARWTERISAVTSEDASRAAHARIRTDDLVIAVVGTAEETLESVRAAIPGLAETTVVPFDSE